MQYSMRNCYTTINANIQTGVTVRCFFSKCSVSKYFGNSSFLSDLCGCLLRNSLSKSTCSEDTGYVIMLSTYTMSWFNCIV